MPLGRSAKWKLALVLSAVAVLGVGCALSPEIIPDLWIPRPGGLTPTVTYSWEVPDETASALPKQMLVYKFVQKNLSEEDFRALASQLGMSGTVERNEEAARFVMRDGQKELWMEWETGMWEYWDYEKSRKDPDPDAIPSDDEVARIATEFLKENGWLPDDFRLQAVTHLTEGTGFSAPITIGKVAYFYRYIGDVPVLGVSRIGVQVGENGEIISIFKFVKDMEPAGNMSLKTVAAAYDEVKSGNAVLTTDNPNVTKAAVQDVNLYYWEDAGSISDQPYLQPVYVFTAQATEGATDTFSVVVPAIKGVALE